MDEPFIRALSRLDEEEWSNADILLVTDGEIRPPVGGGCKLTSVDPCACKGV